MDPLAWPKRALAELGTGAWLMGRAANGLFLDGVENDQLARRRLAQMMDLYIWRPLPMLAAVAALTGLIAGVTGVRVLQVYHADRTIVPALVQTLAVQVCPLLIGIFAAGRVSVDLAGRLGGMQLGGELEALDALGRDPTRYVLSPALGAVIIAAPIQGVVVFVAAWAVVGFMLQPGAVEPWGSYVALTVSDATARALLTCITKSAAFLLVAASIGGAAGSLEIRSPSELGARCTVAFTSGLLGVFTLAAVWAALL
jgi:ABC-type transporter Mla maintaining outer membrane lipid asymmetry permease subunit MlaE